MYCIFHLCLKNIVAGLKQQMAGILSDPVVYKHLWDHVDREAAVTEDGEHYDQYPGWDSEQWEEWKKTPKPNDPGNNCWFTRRDVHENALRLMADGYQVFEKTTYGSTAVLLSFLNFPIFIQRQQRFQILVCVIPGALT